AAVRIRADDGARRIEGTRRFPRIPSRAGALRARSMAFASSRPVLSTTDPYGPFLGEQFSRSGRAHVGPGTQPKGAGDDQIARARRLGRSQSPVTSYAACRPSAGPLRRF